MLAIYSKPSVRCRALCPFTMVLVFVYGTLKNDEPNHHWLTDKQNGNSTLVGEGTTKSKYPLIVATKYNIPFLLDAPGKGYNVEGEIYEVDEQMLSNLDVLEEHPSFYVRREESIRSKEQTVKCWTYFLPTFKAQLLERKMLTSYSSRNEDCGPYLERYLRDPHFNHRMEVVPD